MKTTITALIVTITSMVMAQNNYKGIQTIEVTGQHTLTIDPDEIYFSINFEEYWKEEFEGKKWEDYKTKIDIVSIENKLINELESLGINKKQITLKQSGNGWRHRGKDFLINKNIEIILDDFKLANRITNELTTRGIKSMNVTKLVSHDIDKHKINAQKEALKAAKHKARELAEVYDQKLGKPISIIEVDHNIGVRPMIQAEARAYKSTASDMSVNPVEYENFRKIKVKAELRVAFEIYE